LGALGAAQPTPLVSISSPKLAQKARSGEPVNEHHNYVRGGEEITWPYIIALASY
jgi:hypothetical protein